MYGADSVAISFCFPVCLIACRQFLCLWYTHMCHAESLQFVSLCLVCVEGEDLTQIRLNLQKVA